MKTVSAKENYGSKRLFLEASEFLSLAYDPYQVVLQQDGACRR